MKKILLTIIAVAAISTCVNSVFASEGYYRYPSTNGATLVFSSEGDLWRLKDGDEQATRLTTHDGFEGQAAFSPDGNMLAFAASFDANQQVYVMPVSGGTPRQVTFESNGVTVRGWSPDGRVLYTSREIAGTSRMRELRLVDIETYAVERIPLRYATTGTFNDDGSQLFFVRNGVSTIGDNARLYRGGSTAQLWRFEMGSNENAVRLAEEFDGPIGNPMYWQGRVFFITDQSGWDNIWSMDTLGGDLRQHSNFDTWRLQDASLHDGTILYQRGADIFAFDIATGTEAEIYIDLASDRDRARSRWIDDPMSYLEAAHLGSDNKKAVLTARGRVAIVGLEGGRRIELAIPTNARAREAVLDSEGKWVYVILGQDAESEIWRFAADGSQSGEQLTSGADGHRWRMTLSPDGKHVLHTDKAGRLWNLNLDDGSDTAIYEANAASDDAIFVNGFSPNGRYLVFTARDASVNRNRVIVYDFEEGTVSVVTNSKYSSYSGAFSSDGNWLYFISERNFVASPSGPWGDRNMGPNFDKRGQVFALALNDGVKFPFAAPTELDPEPAEKNENTDDKGGKTKSKDDDPTVDWNAARTRLFEVPVPADNYTQLEATGEFLYLLQTGTDGNVLKSFPIKSMDPELATFLAGVAAVELSNDGSTFLVRTAGANPGVAIVPAAAKGPDDLSKNLVRTAGWRLALEPEEEWQQFFLDGWRMHRDFSFDPAMRGVDWVEVRDRLFPLAARVGHRSELDNLFGQMSYALGILHSQIVGGDEPADDEAGVIATLGAEYQQVADGLQIVHIYSGEPDRPNTLGPLSRPDLDVRVGDVITNVNGRPVSNREELNRALMYQAGEQILLSLSRDGVERLAIVVPVSGVEQTLLAYSDWVLRNAKIVHDASGGKIGYLHLRAMGGVDIASFAREFFSQNHLDGMIIDVRDNNGGNIESWVINQLSRPLWAYWQGRDKSVPYGNMQEAFRGHLAVLVNAGTYSDGDTFAAGVKTLGLAPIIGERTAGAGVWLSDRNSLADRGRARIAEFGQYNLEGEWLIEGRGISPDQEVVANPYALFNGEDAQLDAAIEYLERKIAAEPIPALIPKPLPPVGEYGVDAKR